jgi:hypothetical protein
MKGCIENVKNNYNKHIQAVNTIKDENRILKMQIKRYKELVEKAQKDAQMRLI